MGAMHLDTTERIIHRCRDVEIKKINIHMVLLLLGMILSWSMLWCRIFMIQLCSFIDSLWANGEAFFFCCHILDIVKTSTAAVDRSWRLFYVDLVSLHERMSSP